MEVVIPYRYPLSAVPRFIHQKENWILKHLSANEEVSKKNAHLVFKDGAGITVLGIPKVIRLLQTRKKKSYVKEARALKFSSYAAYYDNHEILIYCATKTQLFQSAPGHPPGTCIEATPEILKEAKLTLEKHLRKVAKTHFQKRTAQIAEQMDLTYKRISIKAQKSRWGSCSRDKNLNFNWRLILTAPEILDSIIIHELAHIKHLNHGKQFYELVKKHCPNHKKYSNLLKNAHFII